MKVLRSLVCPLSLSNLHCAYRSGYDDVWFCWSVGRSADVWFCHPETESSSGCHQSHQKSQELQQQEERIKLKGGTKPLMTVWIVATKQKYTYRVYMHNLGTRGMSSTKTLCRLSFCSFESNHATF